MKLLFVHVPKTGGTSLYRLLCDGFGDNRVHNPRVRSNAQDPFDTDHPVVFGHFFYRAELRARCDYVATMLRDPVDRLFSLYRHARSGEGRKLDLHEAAQRPFSEFIRADWPQLDNWMTRQFGYWRNDRGVTEVAYTRARVALETFDLVCAGPSVGENLRFTYRTLRLFLEPHLGIASTEGPSRHERRGDEHPHPTQDDRRFILSRNHWDHALYMEFAQRQRVFELTREAMRAAGRGR